MCFKSANQRYSIEVCETCIASDRKIVGLLIKIDNAQRLSEKIDYDSEYRVELVRPSDDINMYISTSSAIRNR